MIIDIEGYSSLVVANDYTAAFGQAISDLPPEGGTILVSGEMYLSSNLVANKPVLLKSNVRGDVSVNTNGSAIGAKPAIRWTGASGGVMFTVQPSTVGDVIWGGGSDGIEWDGQGVAAAGVNLDNTKFALFDGKVKGFTWAGVVVSSVSGSATNFSMKNHIRSLEFVWGYTEASANSYGLVLRGNGFDVPSTQQLIGDISGLVYNGSLVQISETDNAQIRSLHAVVQSGGTGAALEIRNVGAQPSHHTFVNYAVGPVKQDSGIIGTKFMHYNSEAGGISQLVNSSKWDGDLIDYSTGTLYQSHKYALRKKIEVSAAMFRGSNTSSADFTFQWNTITWPDGVTSIASLIMPPPYDMDDGVIEGVELLYGSNGTNTGNIKLELRISTAANGTSASPVTPEKVQQATIPYPGQYVQGCYTFAFSPELSYAKGDTVYLSTRRLGADGADTQTQAVHLLGARILYRSTGPKSAGSGSYYIPQW